MLVLRDRHVARVIAANLKRLMEDRREPFTQQRLAEAAHVQQSAISRFLAGQNEAKISVLLPICRALGCNLLQLVDESTAGIEEDVAEILKNAS
jgi:transcriptional regulator with XRE-family HTH domain